MKTTLRLSAEEIDELVAAYATHVGYYAPIMSEEEERFAERLKAKLSRAKLRTTPPEGT